MGIWTFLLLMTFIVIWQINIPHQESDHEKKQNQSIRELGRNKQNLRAHALKKSCLMRQTVTTTITKIQIFEKKKEPEEQAREQ